MSDQHNQNVQQHTNSVQCHRCGSKHLIETEGDALSSALQSGWTQRGDKIVCKFCALPKQPFNVPYVVNDNRIPERDRGCFMNTLAKDGSVIVFKQFFVDVKIYDGQWREVSRPEWDFYKRIE
jgi:hypothetical protein